MESIVKVNNKLPFQPVCDTKGATHANPCAFERAQCLAAARGDKVELRHPGICCEQPCSALLDPQCDSLHRTQPNPCFFRSAHLPPTAIV